MTIGTVSSFPVVVSVIPAVPMPTFTTLVVGLFVGSLVGLVVGLVEGLVEGLFV